MRHKTNFGWTTIPWLLLLFLPALVLKNPVVAGAWSLGDIRNVKPPVHATSARIVANPPQSGKPIRVWEGVSSWYGEPFHGRPTANGETYDMHAATAAHPTLPLGSVVRVVILRTRRSQVVRINDRGPYVEGRELDVSYGVARRLGFDQCGLARVRLELLELPPRRSRQNNGSDRPTENY